MTHWLMSTKYPKGDGDTGQILMFWDDESGKIVEVPVTKGHHPYFYTEIPEYAMLEDDVLYEKGYTVQDGRRRLWNRAKVVKVEQVKKVDPRTRHEFTLSKVSVSSPNYVSNKSKNGLSQILMEDVVYNNNVPYADVFNYDYDLTIGMPYDLETLEPIIDWKKIRSHEIYNMKEIDKYKGKMPKKAFDWAMSIFTTPFPVFKEHLLAVDIECDFNYRDAIDAYEAMAPLSSITLSWYKGDDTHHLTFILSNKTRGRAPLPFKQRHENHIIRKFDTEKEMLKETIKYISNMPQRFVVGFNVDEFDIPYLDTRAKLLGIRTDKIWGYKKQIFKEGEIKEQTSRGVKGKYLIDLYQFFKNPSIKNYAFRGKYEKNSLDSISAALLGAKKYEYETRITDLSMLELAHYNAQDNQLVLDLATHDNEIVMQLIVISMRVGTLTIESACRRYISAVILNLTRRINHYWNMYNINKKGLEEIGEILSTKKTKTGKKYAGAIVFEPQRGVHFKLIAADIASLYPTMIANKNICYSTMNCHHEECKTNKVYVSSDHPIDVVDEVEDDVDTHHICTKYEGVTAVIIGFIRDVRVYYFKKHKDTVIGYKAVEQFLKVLINAAYGVYGFDRFPFFCGPAAEATTGFSRQTIRAVQMYMRHNKIAIDIYGDTDSIFLIDIYNKIFELSKEEWEDLVEPIKSRYGVELGIDERGYAIILAEKKNYFVVEKKDDGTTDRIVAGMVGKKKHVPKIIRDAFTKWGDIIEETLRKPSDIPHLIDKLEASYSSYEKTIRNKFGELSDYSIKITMSKTLKQYKANTPQKKAAEKLVKAIKENSPQPINEDLLIRKGTVIEFIYATKPRGQTTKESLPIELARKSDLDPQEYISILNSVYNQLVSPIKESNPNKKKLVQSTLRF